MTPEERIAKREKTEATARQLVRANIINLHRSKPTSKEHILLQDQLEEWLRAEVSCSKPAAHRRIREAVSYWYKHERRAEWDNTWDAERKRKKLSNIPCTEMRKTYSLIVAESLFNWLRQQHPNDIRDILSRAMRQGK